MNDLYIFWDYIQSLLDNLGANTTRRKAIVSFMEIVGRVNRDSCTLDYAAAKWYCVFSGSSCSEQSTANYLSALNGLYRDAIKAGLLPADNIFDPDRLEPWSRTSDGRSVSASAACKALLQARDLDEVQRFWRDVLMLAVYSGGKPVREATAAKRGECNPAGLPQINDIIWRNQLVEQQQYVFAPSKIKSDSKGGSAAKAAESGIGELLRKESCHSFVSQAPAEAWIEEAGRCGFSDTDIRSVVACAPKKYAYLQTLKPGEPTSECVAAMMRRVADSFADSTDRWYLMRLNGSAARAQKIDARKASGQEKNAAEIGSALRRGHLASESFYPYEEFVKRIGGKIMRFERPFISQFLFIRSSAPKLRDIDDAAKRKGRIVKSQRGGRYVPSCVSESDMLNFKKAVGYITANSEVECCDAGDLNVGDEVEIHSLLPGQTFEIGDIRVSKNGTGKVQLVLYCPAAAGIPTMRALTVTTTLSHITKV